MEPSPGAGRPPRKVVGDPTLAAVEEFGFGLATPTAATAESSCMKCVVFIIRIFCTLDRNKFCTLDVNKYRCPIRFFTWLNLL